ncbi:MAG: hypothetical protein ACLRSW_14780 [Christensenellaceae bacterium]
MMLHGCAYSFVGTFYFNGKYASNRSDFTKGSWLKRRRKDVMEFVQK